MHGIGHSHMIGEGHDMKEVKINYHWFQQPQQLV